MYYTGVVACDAMLNLNLSGNIIPNNWLHTIVKKDLANPKPHLLAILVLGDIVYWYRPKEDRDETTGKVLGYHKRFGADLLQRNYAQIAKQFGCSKAQAKDAITFLEDLGVIKRKFRDITVSGIVYNNQMYIILNVDRLRELTYPSDKISTEGAENSAAAPNKVESTPTDNSAGALPEIPPYTKSTSEGTPESSSEDTPINHSAEAEKAEECVNQEVIDLIKLTHQVPYQYCRDYDRIQRAIRQVTEYAFRMENGFALVKNEHDKHKTDIFHLLVNCLIDMSCAKEAHTYGDGNASGQDVVEENNRILDMDHGSLADFAEYACDAYLEAESATFIAHPRAYLKAFLWDKLRSYPAEYDNV